MLLTNPNGAFQEAKEFQKLFQDENQNLSYMKTKAILSSSVEYFLD
jgi:hypothetical protein